MSDLTPEQKRVIEAAVNLVAAWDQHETWTGRYPTMELIAAVRALESEKGPNQEVASDSGCAHSTGLVGLRPTDPIHKESEREDAGAK